MFKITFLINSISWGLHQWWVPVSLCVIAIILTLAILRNIRRKEDEILFGILFNNEKGINVRGLDGRKVGR
jgi:hypothetical protein